MTEQQRKFEAWYCERYTTHIPKTEDGSYCNLSTALAWKAWQAALSTDAPKYDPATQPGSPHFDGAEAYEAHLDATAQPDERTTPSDHETRESVAKALGLLTGNSIDGKPVGFAWSYLLGVIKDMREHADATTPSDAAITACALMIKGICMTSPREEWLSKIEARIRFMLKQINVSQGERNEQ